MKFFWFVLVVNLLGALYGFIFYYGEQLSKTPLHLLVFVPDCPLYAALFALAMVLLWMKKKFGLFYFITSVGMMKYGIWTMSILLAFNNYFFAPATAMLFAILFVAHLCAVLESLALVGKVKIQKYFIFIGLAWFLLNDVVDYVVGTHPILPTPNYTPVFLLSIFLSISSVIVLYVVMKSRFFLFKDILFGERA